MKNEIINQLIQNISYEPQLNLIVQMFEDDKNKIPISSYLFHINDNYYILLENQYAKTVLGSDYNYIFLKESKFNLPIGFFQRWGKHINDDPLYSPIGPEILDIEISINGCPKIGGTNCKFCYKNNTNQSPTNMSFDTFKSIIDTIPPVLTQVAFGITGVQTNPDFISMMEYCRSKGIIPNFTTNGVDLTDDLISKISKISGAVSVSAYDQDKNICYNTVKKLTDKGMSQINIHIMVSDETLPFVYEVINDTVEDDRLSNLNALVFLGVKPKGRAENKYNPISIKNYSLLIQKCIDLKINFGFDSCSAYKFEKAIHELDIPDDQINKMVECSEGCESDCFSSYINVFGEYWHCSFTEEEPGETFVDMILINDFIKDVWYSESVISFRNRIIESMDKNCRKCIVFPQLNKEH